MIGEGLDEALRRLDVLLHESAPDPPPGDLDLASLATPELRQRVRSGELTWEQVWADPCAVPGGAALVRAALRHRARDLGS